MTYTLHHGNCLDIMPTLEAGSVDMVLADPPYGTTACKWDSVIPFEPMWAGIKHAAKRNAAIVMTASQPFTSALVMSNVEYFKYCWVYRKPQGVDPFMAKVRPLNDIEDIVVFGGKGKTPYHPQVVNGDPYKITRDKTPRHNDVIGATFTETTTVNCGTRLPKRVIDCKQERGLHPTQKPVALMEYLIKTYTNEGDTVLDFAMGSGTCGVACANTGRRFIGIELDAGYFDIASRRVSEAYAQPPNPQDQRPEGGD